MAAHGKLGPALAAYRGRKLRPHRVSGVYVSDDGHRTVLPRGERLRELRHTARGKRKRDYPLYSPYVCPGRRS